MPSTRVAVLAVAVLILVAPLCGAAGPSKCQQEGKFDCMNGKCISGSRWCDGVDNCGNNLDETSCRVCLSGAIKCKSTNQCVPPGARCNGVVECLDKSDEDGCQFLVTERSVIPTSAVSVNAVSTNDESTSGASSPLLSLCLLPMALIVLIR